MPIVITEAKIFACTQSKVLGEKIAKAFGAELGNVITSTYSDGEFQPSYEESIRGTRIFIIGSTNPGPENLMEMLLMIDAAKRASARHITAVLPYFGWARQDRKDNYYGLACRLNTRVFRETSRSFVCIHHIFAISKKFKFR